MPDLTTIVEDIRGGLTAKNQVRDATLNRSRELIRFCAVSIRAIHRHDWDEALAGMQTAREAAAVMVADLDGHPDLYFTGYTQDALKELVEAYTLYAFVRGEDIPTPADLHVPGPAYLNGLAEAASELRRFILDLIRRGRTSECERYLDLMDDVYTQLITVDFPDSLTGGLRRTTDALRAVLERTVGDLTVSMRQEELQAALHAFEQRVGASGSSLLPEDSQHTIPPSAEEL